MIAVALGRTVASVSKKIKRLSLRPPSSVRGAVKGQKHMLSLTEKAPRDRIQMMEILKTYAPLECFQEGQLALEKGSWTSSPIQSKDKKHEDGSFFPIIYSDAPFTLIESLEFIPSSEPPTTERGMKKIQGDPIYSIITL